MSKTSSESLVDGQNRLTFSERIGLGVGAVAVTAFAVWAKLDPEGVRTIAENTLGLFGIDPLFENPVITPQDGGSVMS